MSSRYSLEDLQEVNERCLKIARELGLDPPETLFHLVSSEEIYDIAARGLPGRYSHWFFGQSYQLQKRQYDMGMSRIYELVINTRPAHAYLLEGNSLVAQTLVMAHVLAHVDFFQRSRYFSPADTNILPRVRHAAGRIHGYMEQYGREVVEDFIDHCEALAFQLPYEQLGGRPEPRRPQFTTEPFDDLFPEETGTRKEEIAARAANFKQHFPRQPERDVLKFIAEYAPQLEDWQRDIISIVRTETAYFVPQTRTQILNEGFAVYMHNQILQVLELDTDDFLEYQSMNAGVVTPQRGHPNPYSLGLVMWQEIARIADDPTDEERNKWPWAGEGEAMEKMKEIAEGYDDAAFLAEFLTPRVCELAQLYTWDIEAERRKKRAVISSREHEEILERMVAEHTNRGLPVIEIVDANALNRGELWMRHLHNGLGLDPEYATASLKHLVQLWGKPVVVESIEGREAETPLWYRAAPPGEEVEVVKEEPTTD